MRSVHRIIPTNLVFLNQYVLLLEEEDFSSFMDCTPEEFGAHLE